VLSRLLNTVVFLYHRRLLADQVDVIHVDIWTSIIPFGNYTPPLVWANLNVPSPRLWESSQAKGFGMNVTYLNGTAYTVRLSDNPPPPPGGG
jgi:hypothetical protein